MGIDLTAALDAVDAAFGVAAVYVPPSPPGAAGIDVVVTPARRDSEVSFAGSRGRASTGVFEVRVSDAWTPVKGGFLTVGAAAWIINDAPTREDLDGRVWTLRCGPAS